MLSKINTFAAGQALNEACCTTRNFLHISPPAIIGEILSCVNDYTEFNDTMTFIALVKNYSSEYFNNAVGWTW